MPVETKIVLEVQIVNANSGVTTKLLVKEMDLALLGSAAFLC